jgi:hypothetical protein
LNYPKEMYYALMNLLSSHDAVRVRSVLSTGCDGKGLSREEQAREEISAEQYAEGGAAQRLAALIQFSLPGIPAVYYGDEVGMTGLLDPFNRKPYKVCDEEMPAYYRRLAEVRRTRAALAGGEVCFYATVGGMLGILRYTVCGEDAFGRAAAAGATLTVVNPSRELRRMVVDLHREGECMTEKDRERCVTMDWKRAEGVLSGRSFEAIEGLFEIEMDGVSGDVFELEWE